MRKNQGITLIALVITIIVLLILAGVSISAITGENGIVEKAKQAKEKTVIGKEEELIDLAVTDVRVNMEALNKDTLKDAIVALEGKENVEVIKYDDKTLEVKFKDTGHTYYVDADEDGLDSIVKLKLNYSVFSNYLNSTAEHILVTPVVENESEIIEKFGSMEEFEKAFLGTKTFSEKEKLFIEYNSVQINSWTPATKFASVDEIITTKYSPYTTLAEIANAEGITEDEWLTNKLLTEYSKTCIGINPDGSTAKANFNGSWMYMYNGQKDEYVFEASYLGISEKLTVEAGVVYPTETSGDWDYYIEEDGTATLMSYNGTDTTINVPSEINGLKVTGVGFLGETMEMVDAAPLSDAVLITSRSIWGEDICYTEEIYSYEYYRKQSTITKVVLPEGITTIHSRAFWGSEALVEINIPSTVTSIGANAFDTYSNVTVTVPYKEGEIPEAWSGLWDSDGYYGNTNLTVVYAE